MRSTSILNTASDTVTLLNTVRELKGLGIDIFFEEQNIHTMSEAGEMMLSLFAVFAQEESKMFPIISNGESATI